MLLNVWIYSSIQMLAIKFKNMEGKLLEYVFLGTGAAEAIPCYYCRCSYCSYARQHGGKDVRSRSSFRIDGRYQIDFSPDIFHQTSSLGLDTFELEHLFITH